MRALLEREFVLFENRTTIVCKSDFHFEICNVTGKFQDFDFALEMLHSVDAVKQNTDLLNLGSNVKLISLLCNLINSFMLTYYTICSMLRKVSLSLKFLSRLYELLESIILKKYEHIYFFK